MLSYNSFSIESKYSSYIQSDVFTAALGALYFSFNSGGAIPDPIPRRDFIIRSLETIQKVDVKLFYIFSAILYPLFEPKLGGPSRIGAATAVAVMDSYRKESSIEDTTPFLRRILGPAIVQKQAAVLSGELTFCPGPNQVHFPPVLKNAPSVATLSKDPLVQTVLVGAEPSWPTRTISPNSGAACPHLAWFKNAIVSAGGELFEVSSKKRTSPNEVEESASKVPKLEAQKEEQQDDMAVDAASLFGSEVSAHSASEQRDETPLSPANVEHAGNLDGSDELNCGGSSSGADRSLGAGEDIIEGIENLNGAELQIAGTGAPQKRRMLETAQKAFKFISKE
jgi:hypothetical protein